MKLHQEKIGNMLKVINFISFLILAGYCAAQKPMVQLIVTPKKALVGEEISVIVKTNMQGEINVDLPPSFVQGYSVMNGMEQETDGVTGKSETYYYHSISGSVSKEGVYSFGPAYVNIKRGNVYRSNKVTVNIEKEKVVILDDISSKQLKKPAFGIIGKSKDKIYEGEPLVLTTKIYSHFLPTNREYDYQTYELDGAIEKHEIGNSHGISFEKRNIMGYQMFYGEADKKVVFPMGSGRVLVKPFKIYLNNGFDGYLVTSSCAYINIVPLPVNPPSDFIGGVGNFSIVSSIDKSSYKQGDMMEMTIVVSGEGNLHDIQVPKLNLPKGMVVYGDPIIEEDFTFGISGSQGKITYKYNIQVINSGNMHIPGFTFSYFDTSKEKYITLNEKEETIFVSKNSNFTVKNIPISSKSDDESLTLLPIKSFRKSRDTDYFISSPLFLVSVISPFLLGFVFLFGKKKREKMVEDNKERSKSQLIKNRAWDEIKLAEQHLEDGRSDQFYSSLQQSLFLVCSSELIEDTSLRLTKNELIDQLASKNIPLSIIEELNQVFRLCEEARYGLSVDVSVQKNLLDTTKNLMDKLSKELKQ